MKNHQDNSSTWVTIVVGILMLIAIVRGCDSTPSTSDPDMNRVSRD